MRVLERLGPNMGTILCNQAPWTKEACSREVCPPCSGKPGLCRAKSVTYRISCETCKEEGKVTSYYGETNRTMADRTSEHLDLLRRRKEESILVEHWGGVHPHRKEAPSYKFTVIGRHSSALERQLKEALLIAGSKDDIILNRKSEFGRNSLVTNTIEFDGRKWEDHRRETSKGPTNILPPEPPQEEKEQPVRKRSRQEVRQEVVTQTSIPREEQEVWERMLLRGRNEQQGMASSDRKRLAIPRKRKNAQEESRMDPQRNMIYEWLQRKKDK